MEKMPYQDAVAAGAPAQAPTVGAEPPRTAWEQRLPVMRGLGVTLREPCESDAASLCALLGAEEVTRFIPHLPSAIEDFETFIRRTERQRAAGGYVCFAAVAGATDTAVGLFQIRALEPGFGIAEWDFAIGQAYWGRGLFAEAATLVLDFTFRTLGAHRLEARAALKNGRGNGALAKVGAVREAILRRSFVKNGRHLDQNLWTILEDDWMQTKAIWGPKLH